MNIVFLDDNAARTETFGSKVPLAITTLTAEKCISEIQKIDLIDFLLLDHDLGDETYVDSNREDCGMEVVRWIIANKPNIFQIVVHSLNFSAAKEMGAKLKDAGYNVIVLKFTNFEDSDIYEVLTGEGS